MFSALAVFPEGSPVMSVEAAGIQGWQRWAHAPFGMARFGASAPFKAIYDKFGFTVENLTKQASRVLLLFWGCRGRSFSFCSVQRTQLFHLVSI